MNGLHLLADLYRCECPTELLRDKEILERESVEICRDAGLHPLGACFYQFLNDDGTQAGVTGTVVLAESHLAIHTWPESAEVSLDVYVCNYSRDNRARAKELFERMIALFGAGESVCHEIPRGRLPVAA